MDVNCYGHEGTYARFLRQCTDGEAKQQCLKDGGVHQIPAVQGNSNRRRRLRFQFQNKAAEAEASLTSQKRTRPASFLHSRARWDWEMLVREWGKLGSAIRRAAAALCLAPSAGADEDGDLDLLPYVQLDKVTRAVSREAFGPLYLVT